MIDSRENIELIEKHLAQSLSKSEKELFNEKMQNPEFVQLVEDLSIGQGLLLEMTLMNKKQALGDFLEAKKHKEKIIKKKRIVAWSLISFLLLVSGIFGYQALKINSDTETEKEIERAEKKEPKEGSTEVSNVEEKVSEEIPVNEVQRTVIIKQDETSEQVIDSVSALPVSDKIVVIKNDTTLSVDNKVNKAPQESNPTQKQKTCDDLVLPSFTLQHSCPFRDDGQISWTGIGENDISYEEETLEFNELHDLSEGNYVFVVKSDFCTKDTSITIEKVSCFSSEDYVLQQGHDVTLEFYGISIGEIIFMDKWNREVFRADIEDEYFTWDGYNTNGEQLGVGLYNVLIQGENSRFIKAELTIVS